METDAAVIHTNDESRIPDTSGGSPWIVEQSATVLSPHDERYKTNHKRRGVVAIFSQEQFDKFPNGSLKNARDINLLKINLEPLGFEIRVFQDFSFMQISDCVGKLSNEDYSDADCVMIIVLTIGGDGFILAKDSQYPADILWNPFLICPSLVGKPKIFLIQASPLPKETNCSTRTDSTRSSSYSIPIMADMLIVRSSYPERYFISAFCKELSVTNWKAYNLMTIMTFVSSAVDLDYQTHCEEYKTDKSMCQMTILSTFIRLLYFDME